MNTKRETVFVGLSGGVDSSVAALRLKKEGHRVVGVFIKVWHPDFLICDWEEERLDAMRAAAALDIPFLTFNAEEVYKKDVADYLIDEYTRGRTPNPDVMCNTHVKFGAFLEFAKENGADAVATGHYAMIEDGRLLRGKDANKDQSYFLWALTGDQIKHIRFPVGHTPKEQIRREAARAGLPTADKKDSQGICFLGQIDMKEFLSHYVDTEAGAVLDEQGAVVGEHDGALFYTLGQRHGFRIHTNQTDVSAHYVVAKDLETNTITIAKEPPQMDGLVILDSVNEISPITDGEYEAQFRYRQQPIRATISRQADGTLLVSSRTERPAIGQSCVLYRGEECCGGGIVSGYADH